MTALNKQQLFRLPKQRIEKVDLPEWGEGQYVCVKPMSASELIELERLYGDSEDKTQDFMLHLLAASLCDDKGKRLFSDTDNAAEIMTLPVDVVTRINKAAINVNGLGEKKV